MLKQIIGTQRIIKTLVAHANPSSSSLHQFCYDSFHFQTKSSSYKKNLVTKMLYNLNIQIEIAVQEECDHNSIVLWNLRKLNIYLDITCYFTILLSPTQYIAQHEE